MKDRWEIVSPHQQKNNTAPIDSSMDWQITTPGYGGKNEEGFLESLGKAPFKIGEDILQGLISGIKNIPSYYEKSKTEVPGLFKTAIKNPGSLAMQGLAGSQELINSIAQLPKELTGYAENRLNLLPRGSEKLIEKFSPEDTTQAIKQLFNEPKYEGEELLRGTIRNLPALGALANSPKLLNMVRPSKTAKEFSKQGISDIQSEYAKGIKSQKSEYNKFFKPYGNEEITKTPNQFLELSEDNIKTLFPTANKLYKQFLKKPTANNLHQFQSQLGKDAVKTGDEYLKQTFRDIQSHSQDKLEDFAKNLNDLSAYEGLLKGREITREIVKPFESTVTMRKISQKNIKPESRNFDELINAVLKANESGKNILDPMSGEIKGRIRGVPDSHYLRQLQEQLEKQKNIVERRKKYRNVLLGGVGTLGLEEAIRRNMF